MNKRQMKVLLGLAADRLDDLEDSFRYLREGIVKAAVEESETRSAADQSSRLERELERERRRSSMLSDRLKQSEERCSLIAKERGELSIGIREAIELPVTEAGITDAGLIKKVADIYDDRELLLIEIKSDCHAD